MDWRSLDLCDEGKYGLRPGTAGLFSFHPCGQGFITDAHFTQSSQPLASTQFATDARSDGKPHPLDDMARNLHIKGLNLVSFLCTCW
jgi:hypothetical protein